MMMKRQRKIKNSTNVKCLNVIPMLFIPLIRIRISFQVKMDSKETYDEGNIVILNEFKVSKPVPSNSTSDASNNEHLSKSKFGQPAKKIELEDQSEKTRKLNETIKKLEKDIQKRTQQLNQITNDEDEDSQKQAKIQKLNQIIKNLEKDIERKTQKINQIINDSNNEFKVSKLVPSKSKLDASDDEHVYKSEVEQPAKKIKLDDQGDKIRKLNEIIKKLEKDVQKRTRKLNQISNDFKEDSQKQAEIQKLNQIIKNLEKDIERKTQKLNQITNDLNEKA